MVPSSISIKGFDSAERTCVGTIELPIHLEGKSFMIKCYVFDLQLTYNLLLGRPWITLMKVVPSTLYRCIKFEYNDDIFTTKVDENHFNFVEAEMPIITHNENLINNRRS